VGEEPVNVVVVVVVGDAMERPPPDDLECHRRDYDISSLMAIGSGRAILSRSTKKRLVAASSRTPNS